MALIPKLLGRPGLLNWNELLANRLKIEILKKISE
jgi:hypothetical protein